MLSKKSLLKNLALALTMGACLSFSHVEAAASTSATTPVPSLKDNFYEAINHKALSTHEIAPTETSWSYFKDLQLKNEAILKNDLLKIAAKQGTYKKGSAEQKIAGLYQCATDTKSRNEQSPAIIKKLLAPIEKAQNTAQLTAALNEIKKQYGLGLLLDYGVDRLPDKPIYAVRLAAATPLLTRDDLLKETQPGTWQDYKDYVATVLEKAGQTKEQATKNASDLLKWEQTIAPDLLTSEQENDATVQNNMVSHKKFLQLTKNINGAAFLNSCGISGQEKYFLADPKYLQALDNDYTDKNLSLWKNFFIFQTMNALAPYSDINLRNAARAYRHKRYGIRKNRSDEETNSLLIQGLMPYEFGEIYVKEHCSPETIKDVRAIINEVRQVYRQRLEHNTWLDKSTREMAIKKIDDMNVFVGGPAPDDKPVIDDIITVTPIADGGTLLSNILNNNRLRQEQVHALIGKKFDDKKWYGIDPQDINACYIAINNSITIPAGILQAPFYDPKADRATNLGGIGVVIGHEISHAFDPNGSMFDQNGNMKNWWTKHDHIIFDQKAARFAPYYSKYSVGYGLHENGKLVTPEAIADCGGLSVITQIVGNDKAALRAVYKNFAKVFATKMTKQLVIFLVQQDPHPIGAARVNGALSSTDGFYTAYAIVPGDGMYIAPKDRVKLW